MSIPLLLIASIPIVGITALEAPCRRPHLHHTAPKVEHRNGILDAGDYWALATGPLTNFEPRELAVHSRNKQNATSPHH